MGSLWTMQPNYANPNQTKSKPNTIKQILDFAFKIWNFNLKESSMDLLSTMLLLSIQQFEGLQSAQITTLLNLG